MNDHNIDQLLDEEIPPFDENAKRKTINLALAEFSQKVNHETTSPARLIENKGIWPLIISNWSDLMNLLKSPRRNPILASVMVALIAIAVSTKLPRQTVVDEPELSRNEANSVTNDVESILSADTLRSEQAQNKDNQSRQKAKLMANREKSAQAKVSDASLAKRRIVQIESASPQSPRVVTEKGFTTMVSLSDASIAVVDKNTASSYRPDLNEEYPKHQENRIRFVQQEPVSTFSADVDTASYSLIRNQLQQGFLPAPSAVRSEEVINYFNYDYAHPSSKSAPFKAQISVLDSPWNKSKKLIHIGVKGYDIKPENQPDSNLVFLLDVSGSMNDAKKLPLVKQSIALLLNTLKPSDTISIVVYAGAAGVILEPTQIKEKTKILSALQNLSAGGSTAGGEGIELAYRLAEQNFNRKGVNRIILATDGDFNVGLQSNEALKALVERKRQSGVLLSVLGFGRNNYQDDMMQTLAQNGNGVAAYIDSISEAKKVLIDEASSTLFTIAKDLKFQLEFNPSTVSDYRLLGYETRHLNREDFNNDKVDAGDIGAGHTVTAIYEITPRKASTKSIDSLRYKDQATQMRQKSKSDEYGFLKIRYKLPSNAKSKLLEYPITLGEAAGNSEVNFSVAAASFAQYLKGGKYIGDTSLDDILTMARANKGADKYGYRSEFIRLVELAQIARP